MSKRLHARRLIITGGATGIGRAVALACTTEGARVVIADLDATAGRATAAELGCGFIRCDVSDEGSVRGMVALAAAQMGGLDGLVNNAGLQKAGPIDSFALGDWEALMAVNLRGVFLTTRAAIPHLRAAGGGSIVNTASLAAKRGGPGIAAYAASKGAVLALSTATALELAGDGIRVNSVCPGFIDTPFNGPAIAFMGGRAAQAELVRRMVPLGRQATPDEVAPMYVYLLSDESAYVTAQALSIDGGAYN